MEAIELAWFSMGYPLSEGLIVSCEYMNDTFFYKHKGPTQFALKGSIVQLNEHIELVITYREDVDELLSDL